MVDHVAVDAHYATILTSFTEVSDIENESTLDRASLLSSKIVNVENLGIINPHHLEKVNIEGSEIRLGPEHLLEPSCISVDDSNSIEVKPDQNICDSTNLDSQKNFHSRDETTVIDGLLQKAELNNLINQVINSLPPPSTNNTAVEQPNIGPCSCFICGQILVDAEERYSYFQSQKLFSMQIPLLQLLSDVVNQTVVTNTDCVDLCQHCSEIMNEIDITYKHLNDLKQEIIRLFTVNRRPKLTFHLLHSPQQSNYHRTGTKKNSVNLDDLALTRRKRGRGSKRIGVTNMKSTAQSTLNKLPSEKPVRNKGGRPRKPFQCNICKRKFITEGMIQSHIKREHNNIDNWSVVSKYASNSSLMKDKKAMIMKAVQNVKTEEIDCKNESNVETGWRSVAISELQNSLLAPPVSKNSFITFQSNPISSVMRPIKPKPQTFVQTTSDGSVLLIMNPTISKAAPTLIKISRDYLNLHHDNFSCEICGKRFFDDKSYKMHRIGAHGPRKKKQCENYSLESKVERDSEASSEKVWKCGQCDAKFLNKIFLSEHKKAAHSQLGAVPKDHRREKVYRCEHCDQVFNYKYEYESHKETHLPFNQVGPHEFECCICGLKVASKAALKIHLNRLHYNMQDSKDYLCAKCGYMAGTRRAFLDHVRVHNNHQGLKAQCHICKKEMRSTSFKIHMLRMHGEAKYPCKSCGKKFTIRSDLMKHMNTMHSSLMPYVCNVCGKEFLTSYTLRYHKNKVHSVTFYLCGVCGKSYKWKAELRNHTVRCHSGPRIRYECTLCSRSFGDRRKLKNHMTVTHKMSRESTSSNLRRICSKDKMEKESEPPLELHNIDLPSSVFEPQSNELMPPHTLMTSSHNSSAAQSTEIQLLQPQEADIMQSFQDSQEESITLTTLESHIPSQNEDRMYSQLQNSSHYHHNQMLEDSPQHSTIVTQPHQLTLSSSNSSQTHGNHSPLSQQSELSSIQTIYLVSEPVSI